MSLIKGETIIFVSLQRMFVSLQYRVLEVWRGLLSLFSEKTTSENCHKIARSEIIVPDDYRIKLTENEKKDEYHDFARELKKLSNLEVTIIPIVIGAFGTITKGLIMDGKTWKLETSGDHRNYYIIEIGQNTEKSPGDLRRLAVTQTPVKDHQPKAYVIRPPLVV